MKSPSDTSMRLGAVIGFLLLIAGLSGCGSPRIMGRLDYTDPARSTAGDSVWVQLKGHGDVGATVTVKPDNTWAYQPKGKGVRVWAGEYPPIKKAHKHDADPELTVQALTPTHRTVVQFITYEKLKKQPDKQIRLLYETSVEADTTGDNGMDNNSGIIVPRP